MKRLGSRAGLILLVVAVALVALAATAAARTTSSKASPIVIGWAFDSKGAMAPFDGPALAAAQLRVKQVNARGGVGGRQLQIQTCDTQGNKPAIAKACALKLLGAGANVIFTTCDVDYAAPVVQEAINRGVLAIAPCIGTDQMGPKRFGAKGKLAFSFGNVAQDEGSAMAQYAWAKGWRTASLATDGVIVYFKNVIQAFKARWTQLGGKVVDQETYHSLGGNDVQNAISRLNAKKADVIVTSTAGAFGALGTLISGLRTLGNDTAILNSWAGDGTYWLPKSPQVTNYYFVTYRVDLRRRPERGRQQAREAGPCGHGRLHRRLGCDRRARDGDQAGRRLDERRGARRAAREVQEGTDAVGPRELLAVPAHGVRPAVPRDQDPEQQGAARRHCRRQGRPEDLVRTLGRRDAVGAEARRITPGLRHFSILRRGPGAPRRRSRRAPRRGRRPDRAERSRQVDARQRAQRLRPPGQRHGHARRGGHHALDTAPARTPRARAHVPAHARLPLALGARERRGLRARGGRRASRRSRRATDLLERLGLSRYAAAPAAALAHGDERRLGVARALAMEPRFVLLDEPAAGLPEAEVPAFAELVRSVRDDHGAGVLLIDHNMALIMEISDRIHVLDQGRTLAEGAPAEIRGNLDVAAAYLGETAVAEE